MKNSKKLKFIIFIAILLIIIFENFLLMLRYERIHRINTAEYGVSFSQVQAERYGGNWKENYIAILDDLKFRKLRLPAYWNRIEPQKGNFDFSETDWMINEAEKRGAKVTLVVGQKNIRYPECFYPEWLDKNNPQETSKYSNEMVKKVVEHYKNNPTIKSWQLENEFLLKTFGDCPKQNLTNKQLELELKTLRSVDNTRPVVFSQSDQFGFPVFGPLADTTGFSMYRTVWNGKLGYFRYPQTGHFFWWKASILDSIYGQNIKIHELQAEAWGPVGNENLSFEESVKSMNPQKFLENIEYAKQTRINDVDLWGAEWWYHQKQSGNTQMWEAVKNFINSSKVVIQ